MVRAQDGVTRPGGVPVPETRARVSRPADAKTEKPGERHEKSDKPKSDRIRAEVELTRSEIDQTVNALEGRLSARNLADQVIDMFRTGKAGNSRFLRAIRDNPFPSALAGAGLIWLLAEGIREKPRYYVEGEAEVEAGEEGASVSEKLTEGGEAIAGAGERAKEKIKGKADKTREKVGEVKDRAREMASSIKDRTSEAAGAAKERAAEMASGLRGAAKSLRSGTRDRAGQIRRGFWHTFEDRPLSVGAVVASAGVLAGLLFPRTRTEDKLMGESRDRLAGAAEETGATVAQKGGEVAERAVEAAQRNMPSPENEPEDEGWQD